MSLLRLTVVLSLLALAALAGAANFGKALVGTLSNDNSLSCTIGTIAWSINDYYQATSWTLSGADAASFSIIAQDTKMHGPLYGYSQAAATVAFHPTSAGPKTAILTMAWTAYTPKYVNGELQLSVDKSGSNSISLGGSGVYRDAEVGKQVDGQPEECISSDDNPKGTNTTYYPAQGNVHSTASDPIATRGYPIVLNIHVDSAKTAADRPMGNATFSYDAHVLKQSVRLDNGATEQHWVLVDGDGSSIDFGKTTAAPKAAKRVFSSLLQLADGTYQLKNAGALEHLRRYGNFSYAFNASGKLTKVTDPAGNVQAITYGTSGPVRIDDLSSGKFVTLTYNNGKVQTILQNGGPLKTQLTYVGSHLSSAQFLNADGSVATSTSYTYTNSRLTSIQRDNDPTTEVVLTYETFPTFSSSTGLYRATAATADTTTGVKWNLSSPGQGIQRFSVTNAKGGTTIYDMSSDGEILSATKGPYFGAPGTTTYKMTYDDLGQLRSIKGPGVAMTVYFDSHGQLTRISDGAGGFRSLQYRGADVIGISDALGNIATVSYEDVRFPHVPTKITDSIGNAYSYELNAFGQTVGVTPPTGSAGGALKTLFDEVMGSPSYGWPLSRSKDQVKSTFTSYSPLGDLMGLASTSDGMHEDITNFVYDGAQRLVQLLHPGGVSAQWHYKGARIDYAVAEDGSRTDYGWCPCCGLLLSISRPLNWSISKAIDGDRNVKSFTDPNGHQTTFSYGSLRELTGITYGDGGKVLYSYDSAGRIRQMVNGRGQKTSLYYDAASRIRQRSSTSAQDTYTYNLDGTLKQAAGLEATIAYTYYPANRRVKSVTTTYSGTSAPAPQTLQYDYFSDGKLAHQTWLSGGTPICTWTYGYGAGNSVNSVNNSFGETTLWTYDFAGKVTGQINGNSTTSKFNYNDARNWVTSSSTRVNGGSQDFISGYLLEFDNGHNTVGRITNADYLNGTSCGFSYNALGRLTVERPLGLNRPTRSLSYDLAGNLNKVGGVGLATYDTGNRLVGVAGGAASSDNDGNVVSVRGARIPGIHLTWDDQNRLTSQVLSSGTVTYGYDNEARRIWSKAGSASRTYFVYSGATIVGEIRGTAPSVVYTWGSTGLVSQRKLDTGTSYWYHFGPQGETRALTDSVAGVVATYDYDAYGVLSSSSGNVVNPFRFGGAVGYYSDPGSPFILCGKRWYSPQLGRWLSRDPGGFLADGNLFGYCSQDPVNQVDSQGFQSSRLWPEIIAELNAEMNRPHPSEAISLGDPTPTMAVAVPTPTVTGTPFITAPGPGAGTELMNKGSEIFDEMDRASNGQEALEAASLASGEFSEALEGVGSGLIDKSIDMLTEKERDKAMELLDHFIKQKTDCEKQLLDQWQNFGQAPPKHRSPQHGHRRFMPPWWQAGVGLIKW